MSSDPTPGLFGGLLEHLHVDGAAIQAGAQRVLAEEQTSTQQEDDG